jgi:hypothetical protein
MSALSFLSKLHTHKSIAVIVITDFFHRLAECLLILGSFPQINYRVSSLFAHQSASVLVVAKLGAL